MNFGDVAMLPPLYLLAAFQILRVHAIGSDFQEKIAARAPQERNAQSSAICNVVGSLLSLCDVTAASTVQADCLCYSSSTWVPSIFDQAIATCADYASTALPADAYSLALYYEGFCTKVGEIHNGGGKSTAPAVSPSTPKPSPAISVVTPIQTPTLTSTPAAPIRPSSATNPGTALLPITIPTPVVPSSTELDIFTNPGCSWVSFALSYCNSVTPGFTTIPVASQAPCLCYSSTLWMPESFDGPVNTCVEYVKTADSTFYTDVTSIMGFCTSVGDVLAAAQTGGSQTTAATGGVGLNLPGLGIKSQSQSITPPSVTSPSRSQSPAGAPAPVLTISPNNSASVTGSRVFVVTVFNMALCVAMLLW
ncbi:hypothetical protein BJ878DRAFT_233363 [Calycina marina]|uniref:Extracellular membrane protein CFEM domain-containing protein n=1 Tax=Calycina marina TaxID=1763456 RepID=A0A9P8CC84_9HELO|nr:hypothetical protein BJ878DRAFT_233363 [Calycina marina]